MIRKETGFAAVEGWSLELSDFSSVKAFADRFEKEGGDLDFLVENAAVARYDYILTQDGFEETCVSWFCESMGCGLTFHQDPSQPPVYCSAHIAPAPISFGNRSKERHNL